MGEIQGTVRLKIREGELDAFKRIAEQCVESVRERDSGTIQYDWFFNADETECVVRERYRDSAAVLEHLANLGGIAGALLEVCDLSVEFFGTPSQEMLEALTAFDVTVYAPYLSL